MSDKISKTFRCHLQLGQVINFVWLMVACSKGYVLEEYHLDLIFKYVYDMTMEKEFDKYNEED